MKGVYTGYNSDGITLRSLSPNTNPNVHAYDVPFPKGETGVGGEVVGEAVHVVVEVRVAPLLAGGLYERWSVRLNVWRMGCMVGCCMVGLYGVVYGGMYGGVLYGGGCTVWCSVGCMVGCCRWGVGWVRVGG